MGLKRSALALAGLAAAIAGCAAPAEEYPSLAIRDAERVTGTLEPAAPEPYIPPPPPAGVVDRLAGLQASRSRAMIALADIDRLYVDAALEGTALDSLTAAREQIAGQVEQEDAVVEELLGSL